MTESGDRKAVKPTDNMVGNAKGDTNGDQVLIYLFPNCVHLAEMNPMFDPYKWQALGIYRRRFPHAGYIELILRSRRNSAPTEGQFLPLLDMENRNGWPHWTAWTAQNPTQRVPV
jgi:hypothetical protein